MAEFYPSDPTRCRHPAPEFLHWRFDPGTQRTPYALVQVFRCTECGRIYEHRMERRNVGMKGTVDIQDPRVVNRILRDESLHRVLGDFEP